MGYCPPPPIQEPPGLWYSVHETNVEHPDVPEDPPEDYEPPDDITTEADLGPYQDPFPGPIPNFYVNGTTTLRQDKTLTLNGPVPIRITWQHHSIAWSESLPGFVDKITDDEVFLTIDSPSYTWSAGYEDAGEEVEDYTAEYEDGWTAWRVV